MYRLLLRLGQVTEVALYVLLILWVWAAILLLIYAILCGNLEMCVVGWLQ